MKTDLLVEAISISHKVSKADNFGVVDKHMHLLIYTAIVAVSVTLGLKLVSFFLRRFQPSSISLKGILKIILCVKCKRNTWLLGHIGYSRRIILYHSFRSI